MAEAADSRKYLESEEESLSLASKKKEMMTQQARVAEKRDAMAQREIRATEEELEGRLQQATRKEGEEESEYKKIKGKRRAFDTSLKEEEEHLEHAAGHMKADMQRQVDGKMKDPLSEKKIKASTKLSYMRSEAENMMQMEKKRYDFMKDRADKEENKLASMPDEPKPKALPARAKLFKASNLTKAEQLVKDKRSQFVVEAVSAARSKAIAKEKNQKFLAKTTNTAQGPSEGEMVKEATGKAEKKAIAGLDMQKNEVKEAVKMANKFLEKSSMSMSVAKILRRVLNNATKFIEKTEDVDTLHAIVKRGDKAMRRAVEKHDANIKKAQAKKAQRKELKEKQKVNDEVVDARNNWVQSRMVGFSAADAKKYEEQVHRLSKRIESATPSVQRITSMNQQVHEMYVKARKEEYKQEQLAKFSKNLKLLDDDPDAMEEYANKVDEGRADRKYARMKKAAETKFADDSEVAAVTSSEAEAKVSFKKSENKLEKKAMKEKKAEIKNSKLMKGVDKLKAKVKALEAAAKTAPPLITTELVKPDGELVKEYSSNSSKSSNSSNSSTAAAMR